MENNNHKYEDRLNQSLIKFKYQHEQVLNGLDIDKKIKVDKQLERYEDWVNKFLKKYVNKHLSMKKQQEEMRDNKERKLLRKAEIDEELMLELEYKLN